jgi:hypothetical protein
MADSGVARVLTRLVDEVSEEEADGGDGTRIDLRVSAARLTSTG